MGAARTITECPKDYKIFSQGDPAESVFYIQQGRVKLKVKSKQGKEAVIAILGVGDFLGEACLIGQTVCLMTATVIVPSFILRIEKSEMLRVLHEERRFSDFFVPYVLSRNVRTQEDLVDQLFNSSEQRLARTLLLLAHYGKEGAPESVVPEINQETLAGMVGTTRSRVNFFMNKFKKLERRIASAQVPSKCRPARLAPSLRVGQRREPQNTISLVANPRCCTVLHTICFTPKDI